MVDPFLTHARARPSLSYKVLFSLVCSCKPADYIVAIANNVMPCLNITSPFRLVHFSPGGSGR